MPDSSPLTAAIPESDKYEIVGSLGHGAMGSIYRGRARATGEQVVLKTVLNVDRETPRFLLHEFEIIHELAHPNIVRAFDLFRMEGRVFIALEYFNGMECFRALEPPLKDDRDGRDRLLIVLMQLFDALKYLHDHHILHGELAPPNILLDEDLHVKLVDFEFARRLDRDESHLWQLGAIAGTPRYMAPEQVRGEIPHTASDLFALGLMIFEWLYGESPFGRASSIHDVLKRVLEQRVDVEFLRGRGASSPIADVLARMLDADPSNEPEDTLNFFNDLRQAILQQREEAPRPVQANVSARLSTSHHDPESRSAHLWDVAISFAGHDRSTAKRLAGLLKDNGLRVFYDMDHQAAILGADLFGVLEEVYSTKARYCILLVSEHYSQSNWAWFESRHALVRALAQRTPYVLPIRLDDSELKGLPKSIAYLDLRERSIEDVAEAIIQKIRAA